MVAEQCILKVAINTPLRKCFDYLPPGHGAAADLVPGVRVKVPFGRSGKVTGLLIGITDSSDIPAHRLKQAYAILDDEPLFHPLQLEFLHWASHYYHHPEGEVFLGTLPRRLREGSRPETKPVHCWQSNKVSKEQSDKALKKSPKQRAVFDYLASAEKPVTAECLREQFTHWQTAIKALENKGLVECITPDNRALERSAITSFSLTPDQERAVDTIKKGLGTYQAYLLNGITGSGKTEVYLHCLQEVVQRGMQVLVGMQLGVLHSGLSDTERLNSWLRTRTGENNVLLGTRSAIWTPFKQLGLIIVDEEHDLSYKQQEGFRYSARDLAIVRARQLNIPIILGSATPSLESVFNVTEGKYSQLLLENRVADATVPEIRLQDIRGESMEDALSESLLREIDANLSRKEQTLLFLNRRGYAPVYMCHDCGFIAECPRCEIRMTFHKSTHCLYCHHCEHKSALPETCPACQSDSMIMIGQGTQRVAETLKKHFPGARILRIDRDSTRRKNSMQEMLNEIQTGEVDILVGTQMVAKGHHFPNVTLVGILDADHGLYSADYRASERIGQIIMQVSGRAGREDKPGRVIIQTHFPDHPLLKRLQAHDYRGFTRLLLKERQETNLPPYSYQVMIRAEANQQTTVKDFLNQAREQLSRLDPDIDAFGPFIPPIEKRASRYRMQLLLQSNNRKKLAKLVQDCLPEIEILPQSKRVRWSVDVDPQDML